LEWLILYLFFIRNASFFYFFSLFPRIFEIF